MTKITVRAYPFEAANRLIQQGMHPTLARIYASRGINRPEELSTELKDLLPPGGMQNIEKAAVLLADAIESDKKICVIADYDCDGATACAVAIHALDMMGAKVSYLIPNRFEHGFGLTPAIVSEAIARHAPQVIVTVDNGIASIDGIQEAARQGLEVLITDHHLPGEHLPDNCVIVNPNQPGCEFQSKYLAGVGVIFYVMLALRAELRKRGKFDETAQPRLDGLLDLVALGTVADVVRLDKNNRILVAQGLKRITAGNMQTGIAALFRVSGREWINASTYDLGFLIAPRINAAGRLEDMAIGVECLITDNVGSAWEIAEKLDSINRERREIESSMHAEALDILKEFNPADRTSICVLNENWHQGVIGILASRLKDTYYRPAFVFAANRDGLIRGSGRSIPGFHLRDAIDLVSKRHPDIITNFGGHALAAGLTMHASGFDSFYDAFEEIAQEQLGEAKLEKILETDGVPDDSCYTLDFIRKLDSQVWGQGFAPPVFSDRFEVVSQRVLQNRHLSMQLKKNRMTLPAIYFGQADMLPKEVLVAYRIAAHEYNGVTSVRLIVSHAEAA